jgi:hypothetical protein
MTKLVGTQRTGKDYVSFSSAAKSRFRRMAEQLGYEQITGVIYVKERDGWYELFYLQASSWGNPFFYFNYGVICPDQFPLTKGQLRTPGWIMGRRLDHPKGAFPCGTKAEIDESAAYAYEEYKKHAVPWFASLTLETIKSEKSRRLA